MTVSRLILGDQLNHWLSSLSELDINSDIGLMDEAHDKVANDKHHDSRFLTKLPEV